MKKNITNKLKEIQKRCSKAQKLLRWVIASFFTKTHEWQQHCCTFERLIIKKQKRNNRFELKNDITSFFSRDNRSKVFCFLAFSAITKTETYLWNRQKTIAKKINWKKHREKNIVMELAGWISEKNGSRIFPDLTMLCDIVCMVQKALPSQRSLLVVPISQGPLHGILT